MIAPTYVCCHANFSKTESRSYCSGLLGVLCYYCRILCLDTNSFIVLLPYLRFNRLYEFTFGVIFNTGKNAWCTWFADLSVLLLYWEVGVGVRYTKRY